MDGFQRRLFWKIRSGWSSFNRRVSDQEEFHVIRLSVLYPDSEGATFDKQYYLDSHMPMVREKLGSSLLKDEIWSGVSVPGLLPVTYLILLHMYFESAEVFGAGMQEYGATFMEDVPNFTNVAPVLEMEQAV
jgi:uncharacterized protein (TIGR02118 family)